MFLLSSLRDPYTRAVVAALVVVIPMTLWRLNLIGLKRSHKGAKTSIPQPGEVAPGDPKWEVIGDRVIRKYKGSDRPAGIWPEVWQLTPHKERLRLIKEAKEFNETNANAVPITAMPEGTPPTDTGTGEGCWPGAPAGWPAMPKKEVVRHIVELCTSENSRMGDQIYTKSGCTV